MFTYKLSNTLHRYMFTWVIRWGHFCPLKWLYWYKTASVILHNQFKLVLLLLVSAALYAVFSLSFIVLHPHFTSCVVLSCCLLILFLFSVLHMVLEGCFVSQGTIFMVEMTNTYLIRLDHWFLVTARLWVTI